MNSISTSDEHLRAIKTFPSLIPAQRGCKKKVWFNLDKDIKAVLIQKDGMERVCMITEAATPEFKIIKPYGRGMKMQLL